MKWVATLLVFAVFAAGCRQGAGAPRTSPTAPDAQSPEQPGPSGPIRVGQEVRATLEKHGAVHLFELTAPSSGTLTARVTWSGYGSVALQLGEVSRQGQAPLVASLPVEAGARYQVRVSDAVPWDYEDWHVDYVLTTAIER